MNNNIFNLDLSQGIIAVHCFISGPKNTKMIKMALDTGATYTIIPAEVAIACGYNILNPTKKIEISTANADIFVPIIVIKSIKCLEKEIQNLEVICHSLPPHSPIEGLLGLNFLKHFDLYLLFKKKILQII